MRREKRREEGPRWTSRGSKNRSGQGRPGPEGREPMAKRTRQRCTRGVKTRAVAGDADREEQREQRWTGEQSKAKEGQQMHQKWKACSREAQGGEETGDEAGKAG